MAVTRSTAADRQAAPPLIRAANPRTFELDRVSLFASLLVTGGVVSHLQREDGAGSG